MATQGQLTAYLAEARERAEGIAVACEPDCGGEPCTGHDALRLLDAVEAALKQHQPHQHGRDCVTCTSCGHCGGWPCAEYRAISAALLGEEKSS